MSSILRCLFFALWLLAAAIPPAAAANFGLTGGDESGQAGPSADDLFKGGDVGGFAPVQDPAIQEAPPLREDDRSNAPAATPASRAVELVYDGHAAADGRAARIILAIAPDGRVTGTITIQSVCEPNIHLGGADLTFNAQLSGTWESSDGSVDGTWSGTEHFCGTDAPNEGTLKFFRKVEAGANPVLHLRITGKNGRYGWNFPPTDQVYATAAGVPPSDEPATEPASKPVTEGVPPPVEIDPDRVTGIVILPSEMLIGVGAKAELPQIYAIVGDTADKVLVPSETITWSPSDGLAIAGGEIEVPAGAQEGARLHFSAKVALSLTKIFTASGTVLVNSGQMGSIEGKVFFFYRFPYYQAGPRQPLWATVELQPSRTTGPPLRRITTGPDGRYRFDRLPPGGYRITVTGFSADPFPAGYRLKLPNGPWNSAGVVIPSSSAGAWDLKPVSVEVELVGPDYDASSDAVTGVVLHRGEGVAGVTVRANRLGSEGGEKSVTSGAGGKYRLEIDDMEPGTYWLRAEKFVVARWAGPDDLLDVASARDQRSVLFTVPFFGVDEISIDIDVLTRNEIFGGERTPEQPTGLP